MGEVSFICKRTVISTKPVEPGKFSRLSVLDRIMERNHLRIVMYYNLPTRRRPGEVTKKLRESISEALSAFPPVLGRLVRTPEGRWTVKCNDAGVRMVEAKVNATVQEWLHNVDRDKELMLVHWEEIFHKPYFWSTFYVQITEFECGGLAIGLSCTHMLSDPASATMLIKAWADATVGGQSTPGPLFRPLPTRPPREEHKGPTNPNSIIDHYKSAIQGPTQAAAAAVATVTLHFNRQAVSRCILAAGGSPRGVGPFEALSALLWARISEIRGGVGPGLSELSICVDARGALGLGGAFFGSCAVFKRVGAAGGSSREVAGAAAAIREAAEGVGGDEVAELIEWLERENCGDPPRMNGGNLVCVNLEGLGAYAAAFEGHAPLRASYYVEPVGGAGQVLILPSAEEAGGRVAAVTLAEDEARKLLEDSWIDGIGASVVMGLSKKAA